MADQPTTEDPSTETPPAETLADDTDDTTDTATTDTSAAGERRAQLRGRAILAGAATALTLGGGLTGFVIGHSTAGADGFQPANFRQVPGEGQQLDNGQQPPGFNQGGTGPGDSAGGSTGDGSAPGSSGSGAPGTVT